METWKVGDTITKKNRILEVIDVRGNVIYTDPVDKVDANAPYVHTQRRLIEMGFKLNK